jgi:hypothetical protein
MGNSFTFPQQLERVAPSGQLCFRFHMDVAGTSLRPAVDAWPCCFGRHRRWRDAVFEGSFGRSPERTKFAEPKNDTAMRFIHNWSRRRPSTSYFPIFANSAK